MRRVNVKWFLTAPQEWIDCFVRKDGCTRRNCRARDIMLNNASYLLTKQCAFVIPSFRSIRLWKKAHGVPFGFFGCLYLRRALQRHRPASSMLGQPPIATSQPERSHFVRSNKGFCKTPRCTKHCCFPPTGYSSCGLGTLVATSETSCASEPSPVIGSTSKTRRLTCCMVGEF